MAQSKREGGFGDLIKKAIASRLSEKLRDDPDTYDKLIQLGLVDAEAIASLPANQDFGSVVRQFRDGIAELARTEPSVLKKLDVRPIDVMCSDEEELRSAQQMAKVPLTVLFSDLAGFTSFTSTRGDDEAGALLVEHYEEVDAIVRGRGGRVIKTIGDGHMVGFEQPSAAVMAAVDLVAASPAPLLLRVGAHLGPVVRTENDLLGHVVNVAAKVTRLAAGGASVVTVDLRDAAGRLPRIAYEPARSERLAGLEDPVDVCDVHEA